MTMLTGLEAVFASYFSEGREEFAQMSVEAAAACLADRAAKTLPDDNSLAGLICQHALDEVNWLLIAEVLKGDLE